MDIEEYRPVLFRWCCFRTKESTQPGALQDLTGIEAGNVIEKIVDCVFVHEMMS